MSLYEHDCPDCRCLHPANAQQWMADRLNPTPDPAGLDPTTGDLYASYTQWVFAHPDLPGFVLTQNQLTRWLRRRGVQFYNSGGKGNRAASHSFKRRSSTPPVSDLP